MYKDQTGKCKQRQETQIFTTATTDTCLYHTHSA